MFPMCRQLVGNVLAVFLQCVGNVLAMFSQGLKDTEQRHSHMALDSSKTLRLKHEHNDSDSINLDIPSNY